MEKIFEQFTEDLKKRNQITFGTFPFEIDGVYNDCHPYSQEGMNLKYYLEDRTYGNYTVECCILPTFFKSAAQAGDYAPISIEIIDNPTEQVVLSCTCSKSLSYSFGGRIIDDGISCKGPDKGFYHCVSSNIDEKHSPSVRQSILTKKLNAPKGEYKDVTKAELDEYININGLPTPTQIREITQLIFEKISFCKSGVSDIRYGKDGVVESSGWDLHSTTPTKQDKSQNTGFPADKIAERIPASNPFDAQREINSEK